MKRSEMVKILENAINSGLYQDYQFSTESVSDILSILEKAGMQPPTYERGPNEVELQAGLEKEDRVFVTEWEPENET